MFPYTMLPAHDSTPLESLAGCLVECVPNASSAHLPVVGALERALAGPGSLVLDRHRDPDHDRCVLTAVGSPEGLVAGALRLFEAAFANVDVRANRGVHPHVGALDVVPFVALAPTPPAAAADSARALGALIAERFPVPVLLYGEAASSRERSALPAHRRGGLAGLAERMARGAWPPDYGPATPHPRAGVVLVGARRFSIALNAVLDGPLATARTIARRIRESSGGLGGVRALGVPLASRGLVQVTCNLTDPGRTSLDTLARTLEHEAERSGCRVLEFEIVGLVPAEAVGPETAALLRLPHLSELILERRIERTRQPG